MNPPAFTFTPGPWLRGVGLLVALVQVTAGPAAEPTAGAHGTSEPAGKQRPALRGDKNLGPFTFFDTDHDGILSPAEIAGAAEALRQLDKNHDGSLTGDELPRRRPGPPPRDRGPGANDDGPPSPAPQT
jgi:hypothetical protein